MVWFRPCSWVHDQERLPQPHAQGAEEEVSPASACGTSSHLTYAVSTSGLFLNVLTSSWAFSRAMPSISLAFACK